MKRVAIIGGGLSGVSAAYEFARDGVDFVLFEASSRLGGIVETVRRDGFVIECGADSWVTEKPWARELAVELGLEAEIIPSNDARRRTYLLVDERSSPMPDGMRMMVPTQWEPVLNSPLFSEEARVAFLSEYRRANDLKASSLPEGEDESVASFVRRHFGEEVTRTIAAPLLAGVFGGSVETLSVRAVMPAFVKLEREHGSLIAALQKKHKDDSGSVFTSLKSGLETLIDHMAGRINPKAIRLNQEVQFLIEQSDTWCVETAEFSDSFDDVVVATPAQVTRRLISPLHADFPRVAQHGRHIGNCCRPRLFCRACARPWHPARLRLSRTAAGKRTFRAGFRSATACMHVRRPEVHGPRARGCRAASGILRRRCGARDTRPLLPTSGCSRTAPLAGPWPAAPARHCAGKAMADVPASIRSRPSRSHGPAG